LGYIEWRQVVSSDKLTEGYGEPSAAITGDYWAEDPTVVKVGDYWVVYFDKYKDHKYGAIRSKDLENWEDVSSQISLPEGIRHGTIFQVPQSVFENLKKIDH
jgi:beta-xylosidase